MQRLIRLPLLAIMTIVPMACSLSSLVDGAEVSSETKDPTVFRTPQGAIAAYHGAQIALAAAIALDSGAIRSGSANGSVVYISGLLSDELRASNMAANFPVATDAVIDSRIDDVTGFGNLTTDAYERLHHARAMAREARGLVREFTPGETRDLVAQLYATEGYATLLLADLFCSGIPLSYVTYKGDYVITRGHTTKEVYEHTLAIFDSAAALVRDSATLTHLINVGRGRTLLAMGRYADAADAVQHVPDAYRYEIPYSASYPKSTLRMHGPILADGNGGGIRFISDHDPRATLPSLSDKNSPLLLASGVEARLIAVEAAIHADNPRWIDGLNALRTTCTVPEDCSTPAPPGIGNVASLAPLTDSALTFPEGARFNKRIDILFRERAYWLLLTGHRQGDLRRLVREYGRQAQTVYPSGIWGSSGFSAYGRNTNFVIPKGEESNSLYHGCLNREA